MTEQPPIETLTLRTSDLVRLHPPGPYSVAIVNADRRTLVTLYPDGRVEYDPADLDEAARLFWDSVRNVAAAPPGP